VNSFLPSNQLLTFLTFWEAPGGVPVTTAYLDQAGVPTIGYGHVAGVQIGDTCTADQAWQWLNDETGHSMTAACPMVTYQMQQNEADAIGSFAFNVGTNGFAGSSILANMNRGRFDLAAPVFLLWDKVRINGILTVDPGVLKRRQAEQAIFSNADYSLRP
jgi:lysozyme